MPGNAFSAHGFRGNIPAELRAETGRILSRWGDAGWGQIVAEDKHVGRFRDELADAVVEMTGDRWQPEPRPTWVTCVPSRRHVDLVPDLARRVAERLRLPFQSVVKKVRDNEPQKLQQNRCHQCTNLNGVFEVVGPIPKGPVLLLDDIVDSAWTMTLVAALLWRVGAGPVWPVTLATTSTGD